MADMPDLSHLTPEERAIIENVIHRQKIEEDNERELMKWVLVVCKKTLSCFNLSLEPFYPELTIFTHIRSCAHEPSLPSSCSTSPLPTHIYIFYSVSISSLFPPLPLCVDSTTSEMHFLSERKVYRFSLALFSYPHHTLKLGKSSQTPSAEDILVCCSSFSLSHILFSFFFIFQFFFSPRFFSSHEHWK